MTETFPARLGQVILVEEIDEDPLTGIVLATTEGAVSLDLTSAPRALDHTIVQISVFAPEALYRATATATLDGARRLLLDDLRDVETVQRRRWPRRQVTMPVSLVTLDAPAPAGVLGETIDIGVGGTRVHTSEPVPPGADPMVTLTLPDGNPLLLPARVVFAEAADDGYDYRLAFCDLDDGDAARLAEVVGAVPA